MSFSQERLWFLDQLEPGTSAYNLPGAVRLRGNLNLICLEQVLNEIITRHEILRTNFDMVDDQPVQIITPHRSLPLTIRDLGELSPSEQIEESKRLIEEESQRPFDLCKDPLVRATLLKLGDADHVFTLTFHHIVSDGWSRAVFTREFLALYEAFVEGHPNPLTPLPIQYADFAGWQRKFLQGERLETQLTYWKGQLSGDLPQMDMLLDKPRPATLSHRSQHIGLILPGVLSQELHELSLAEGATLFMTMLAAFKVLLQRYTGLEDIVVGSPIAGRNRAEIENLIGFFVNTLVVRTNLAGNPTFREMIGRVKKVALDAYTHQDIPFEALLIELHPERDLNRTPLFQVFFNMLNLDEKEARLARISDGRL